MARITVDLDDQKLQQAMRDAGSLDPQQIIDMALTEYVSKRAKLRLAGIAPGIDIRKRFADFERDRKP